MKDPESSRPADARHLLVEVGSTTYALPARWVVHSMASAAGLSGTVPLRGATYPVLDLRRIFRLPAISGECQAIFLDQEGHRTAFLVDTLLGFEQLDAGALLALPWTFSGRERSWFEALSPKGEGFRVLLCLRELLASATATETNND